MFNFDEAVKFLQSIPSVVGDDPEDELFKIAVLILTRAGRRKDVFNTARMTGYDEDFVSTVRKNLIAGGYWSRKEDKATYLDRLPKDRDFIMGFVMAVLVGAGRVVRDAAPSPTRVPAFANVH